MLRKIYTFIFPEKTISIGFMKLWLNVIVGISLAVMLLRAIGVLFFNMKPTWGADAAIIAGLLAILWLSNKGHELLARVLLVTFSAAGMLISTYSYGGVRSISYSALILAIVIAAMLMRSRVAVFVMGISILFGWILAQKEMQGTYIPNLAYITDPYRDWMGNSILFIISAILVGMSSYGLRKALSQGVAEIRVRRQAEDKLKEQAHYLTALHHITLSLLERKEIDYVLNTILDQVEILVETDSTYIDVLTPDGEGMLQKVGHGVFAKFNNSEIRQKLGVSWHVVEEKKTIIVSNYQTWEGRNPDFENSGFWATVGLPLKVEDRVIGAIGIAHTDPNKDFSQAQIYSLERFAEMASVALDNARLFQDNQAQLAVHEKAQAELIKSEEYLNLALDAANMGIWAWDIPENQITWSKQVYDIFETTPEAFKRDFDSYIMHIYPADVTRTLEIIQESLKSGDPNYLIEHRIVTGSGKVRWVEGRGKVYRDENQAPIRMTGIVADITTKKQAEEALKRADRNVARYTSVLERRTAQLSVAAEVSRAASAILDSKSLSQQVVELVRNKFALYYAGLFMVDETQTWAVLQAATGDAGKAMLEQGHRLEIGDTSMVGWCIQHRQPRIALDVGEDAVRFNNPNLPETRSELAMPLISRGNVLGALTIQSSQPSAFSKEDIETFQTMADQLANAIMNARLYDQLQQELNERIRAEEEVRNLNTELEARVERRTLALQASEEKFRALAENNPLQIARYDQEGRYLYVNRLILNPRVTPQDVIGKTLREAMGDQPVVEIAEALIKQVFETGEPIRTEYNVGETFAAWWLAPEFGPDGKVQSVITSTMDITDRKRMEEDLQKRSVELQAANRELESFSYSVSHDLRAPLRALDGFSRILLDDFNDKLDESGQNYLNRIRNAAQEMNKLIDDILRLSRVTRAELNRDKVDLTELALGIIEDIKSRDPERIVEIEVSPGLTTQADYRLLRVALENLLNNAWKFTRKAPNPRITVGKTTQRNKNIFFVRDNGVGFDMKYAEKLFVAFQRLHSADDFSGTGIGLAIVNRVIQKHGGRIWAESEPGQGTTFFFTL
jgi:PAS domain S-box-containing protein